MVARIIHDLDQLHAYPRFRVYTRENPTDAWEEADVWSRWRMSPASDGQPIAVGTTLDPGLYVQRIERVLLPSLSAAVLWHPVGVIEGEEVTAPDLEGLQIRIDAAIDPPFQVTVSTSWVPVFWGRCHLQQDETPGCALISAEYEGQYRRGPVSGRRIYHCRDLLYDLSRRYLVRHWYQSPTGSARGPCSGHPGYNAAGYGRSAAFAGNRGDDTVISHGQTIYPHTLPGRGTAWTDAQVIADAMDSTFITGDQEIVLDDPHGLLDGVGVWPMRDGVSVLDLVLGVCRRQRGLGCAFAGWNSDCSEYRLSVRPQLLADTTVPTLTGTRTVLGATAAGTAQDLVITGDHRVLPGSCSYAIDREHTAYEVETVGERIQVLASIEPGKWVAGWGSGIQTEWNSAAAASRDDARYAAVYRLLCLDPAWNFATDAAGIYRIDYRCADDGTLVSPGTADDLTESMITLRILSDCPAIEGQTLTSAAIADETSAAQGVRVPPAFFILHDTDVYHHFDRSPRRRAYQRRILGGSAIHLAPSVPERTRRDSSSWWGSLVARVGLELGARVRRRSTTSVSGLVGRQRIELRDHHLWIGHRGAMVDITAGATTAERIGATAVLYRDDRARLSARHLLACAWYLQERRALSYSLGGCCALTGVFTDSQGEQVYPQLGNVTATASVDDAEETVNSVCSRIVYQDGDSHIEHSWTELDR